MASTTISPNLQATRQAARIATVSMISIIYFAAAIVALHLLRPDHNPVSQPTSEYAVGPYSFLMTSAFFSMSLASLTLVVAFFQGIPEWARSRIGLALLGVWG